MTTDDIIKKNNIRFPGPRTIECGEGWVNIINEFFIELDRLDQKFRITVFCIKEKFGTMRIQLNFNSIKNDIWDSVQKLELKYEDLSKTICENCGKPGKMDQSKHWLKVSCKGCK